MKKSTFPFDAAERRSCPTCGAGTRTHLMTGRPKQAHNPLRCILPDYVLETMADAPYPEIRRIAIAALAPSASFRGTRQAFSLLPFMAAIPSPAASKHRLVYTMEHKWGPLPGTLTRSEGDPANADSAVNEAYDFSGHTYDFYQEVFARNSLDDNGMTMISSVHYGEEYENAFWNGDQMVYGDGDGSCIVGFSKSLDVVAHELTHGVQAFTSNLEYQDEPGALNEHFSDVFGILVEQWLVKQTAEQSDWCIGTEIFGEQCKVKGLRTFKAEKAYENHPILKTDLQPKHMEDKYTGSRDNGGVHINSGIPNHAFYLVAMELGGFAWQKAGSIWYKTMLALTRYSNFQDMARMTHTIAGADYGFDSAEQKAVKKAWNAVGIPV